MKEQITQRRWFWAWDFDKEETWLNEMAASGWILDKIGFCKYTFIKCEPEEYTVRLQMYNFFRSSGSDDYIQFVEDTGAEYIGRLFKWVYFRKRSDSGAFELFSDLDSRIRQLDILSKILLIISIANIGVGIANTILFPHMGWINLLCAALLMYGLGRIHGKKETMERRRILHE